MTDFGRLADDLRERVRLMTLDLGDRIEPAGDSETQRREGVREKWAADYARLDVSDAGFGSWCAARARECAAAWVFATALVRFCEENSLIAPVFLAGAGGEVAPARAAQKHYFAAHPPTHTDREYLGKAIAYFTRMPATRTLFGRRSAIRLLSPSTPGAHDLVEFWREADDSGTLLRDFAGIGSDATVLVDLYAQSLGLGEAVGEPVSASAGSRVDLGVMPVAGMLRDFAAAVNRMYDAGLGALEDLGPGA